MKSEITAVLQAFSVGAPLSCTPLSGGTIHRTYLVTTAQARYVLQEMHGFPDNAAVMENIARVTAHLRGKGLPTLRFYPTAEGWLHAGRFRLMDYIPGAGTPPPETAGFAFGQFAAALGDLRGLTRPLPGFHDTAGYVETLRATPVPADAAALYDRLLPLAEGACARSLEMPGLRIIHGDTKAANVRMAADGRPVVIDLDTVMEGSLAYDYGDGIRSAAGRGTALHAAAFRAFTRGYLRGFPEMTAAERASLAPGIFCVTAELAVRYLTDYAQGCTYFRKTPAETLQRVCTLTALAEHIRQNEAALREEIQNLWNQEGSS